MENQTVFTLFQDYHTKVYRAQWLLPAEDEPQWFHGRGGRWLPEDAKQDVLAVKPDAVYMETEAFQAEVQRRQEQQGSSHE